MKQVQVEGFLESKSIMVCSNTRIWRGDEDIDENDDDQVYKRVIMNIMIMMMILL